MSQQKKSTETNRSESSTIPSNEYTNDSIIRKGPPSVIQTVEQNCTTLNFAKQIMSDPTDEDKDNHTRVVVCEFVTQHFFPKVNMCCT